MSTHERIYRRLLSVYPAAFRARYAEPMAQLFADQLRDTRDPRRPRRTAPPVAPHRRRPPHLGALPASGKGSNRGPFSSDRPHLLGPRPGHRRRPGGPGPDRSLRRDHRRCVVPAADHPLQRVRDRRGGGPLSTPGRSVAQAGLASHGARDPRQRLVPRQRDAGRGPTSTCSAPHWPRVPSPASACGPPRRSTEPRPWASAPSHGGDRSFSSSAPCSPPPGSTAWGWSAGIRIFGPPPRSGS